MTIQRFIDNALIGLFAAAFFVTLCCAFAVAADGAELKNIRVKDGDTFSCVIYGEFGMMRQADIRVMGFDAWESHKYRRESKSFRYAPGELAKGALATAALQKLLSSAKTVTAIEPKDVDPHSRQLAWVYADGKEIGQILRAQGHERKNP